MANNLGMGECSIGGQGLQHWQVWKHSNLQLATKGQLWDFDTAARSSEGQGYEGVHPPRNNCAWRIQQCVLVGCGCHWCLAGPPNKQRGQQTCSLPQSTPKQSSWFKNQPNNMPNQTSHSRCCNERAFLWCWAGEWFACLFWGETLGSTHVWRLGPASAQYEKELGVPWHSDTPCRVWMFSSLHGVSARKDPQCRISQGHWNIEGAVYEWVFWPRFATYAGHLGSSSAIGRGAIFEERSISLITYIYI